MHDLELDSVGTQKINRVPSAGSRVGKLARAVENLGAETLHQFENLVDLLVALGVEGEVMQADLVNLERMRRELGLRFLDVNRGAV